MLSHLRFHRRGQSNPTSPNPEQPSATSPWDPQQSPFIQDAALSPDARSPSATNSSLPPTLPPIARVTSSGSKSPLDRSSLDFKLTPEPNPPPKQQPPRPPVRSPYNPESGSKSGFLGGVALRKFQSEEVQQQQLRQLRKLQMQQQQAEQEKQQQMAAQSSQSPDSAGASAVSHGSHESQFSRPKPAPPPINTAPPSRPPPQPTKTSKPSSFATPTELHHHQHHSPSQSQPDTQSYATGRRPAGTRLSSEPTNVRMSTHAAEAPKGRKGLPFLKNPMSTLLMRRKTSQNAPDLSPLPLGGHRMSEPSYDPRIRGTRVHDFSAPRPRRSAPSNESSAPAAAAKAQPPIPEEKLDLGKTSSKESTAPTQAFQHGRNVSSASESDRSGSASVPSGSVSVRTRSSLNLDTKPLPDVPPKDDSTSSSRSASIVSKKPSIGAASILSKTTPSTRTNRSRHVSMGGADVLSSVPRHMKSTSSRFSFDMIGAAKQEKLLEERHRQRELERKTSDPNPNRDSRFDDFDDDFDYDAMMDDDGMEEPIPMSNNFGDDYPYEEDFDAGGTDPLGLDAEEDFDAAGTDPLGLDAVPEVEIEGVEDDEAAMDPDNDQENFAGFVFQRSNPASALTSPHSVGIAMTPRDADGRVIGFAISKDTPDLNPNLSPDLPPEQDMPKMSGAVAGLAIQGLDVNDSQNHQEILGPNPHLSAVRMPSPVGMAPPKKDDLYFDNGLLDELDFAGEGDGSAFDESIFDLDDTDQYGRPLPGVFAKAQAARAAAAAAAAPDSGAQDSGAPQNAAETAPENAPVSSKRISDSTSRLSAQSSLSQSTAHTSLSVCIPAPPAEESKPQTESQAPEESSMTASTMAGEQDKMEAYQAALAAAACEAAANGKFRRDSSPPPSEILSPGGDSLPAEDNYLDDYNDYNDFNDDLGDYDMDYDDFIAEANASALANDSDGWYGQEFGFYSAPIEGRHSRDNSNGSDEKPFQYANGGFFGPSGVARSKSGRMISREPNLTPITERSEYSNRNSIMSLAVPPIGSGPSSLQSPGLAQLAMMADGDDNMSLMALMKLRSRAWGGSQASLVSSRDGSPRSERGDGACSPWSPVHNSNVLGIHNGHVRKNSSFSIRSRDMDSSDAGSASGSPTLTMSMPTTVGSPVPPLPPLNPTSPSAVVVNSPSPHFTHSATFEPVMESDEANELSISNSISHSGLWMKSPNSAVHPNLVPRTDPTPQRRPGMGHKHKGSADSISYIKEENEGETRWVLERRFTADSGEIEVQREVVGMGRI